MRGLFVVPFLSLALFAAGCGEEKPAAASSPAPSATPAASTPAPAPSPAPASDNLLVVTGPIIVEHQMDVLAQRDGTVTKIYFDAPARVNEGDLLAQLDDRQLRANLEAAKAKSRSIEADLKNWKSEAEVLKADYARQQRLFDLGLTSEEQLQHAKYKSESDQFDIQRVTETLNTSRMEEHALELEIEKTRITSPFSGLIARRYIRDSQAVAKGDRLFWVTSEAPLLLRVTLPEKFFSRIRSAKILDVSSPDVPGEHVSARIKQISPVIDPASGTFEILVELTSPRTSLRPGMNASARIEAP